MKLLYCRIFQRNIRYYRNAADVNLRGRVLYGKVETDGAVVECTIYKGLDFTQGGFPSSDYQPLRPDKPLSVLQE